ncbi:hypothetical protein LINPERPRIM_LOCUS27945 [Linum perenne]
MFFHTAQCLKRLYFPTPILFAPILFLSLSYSVLLLPFSILLLSRLSSS